MVIMAIGVLYETSLAVDSGLTVGSLGGISVNPYYPTNDENIYAIEVMLQKVIGSSVVKLFDMHAAVTGLNERMLRLYL